MTPAAWTAVTQFGNSMLLLPAALALMLWMLAAGERRLALAWALCFGPAVMLVLASKLAFLGWGIGSVALDFTGASGHSMVSTAVFTVLAALLARGSRGCAVMLAGAAGLGIGLFVSWSRLALGVHSTSEVVLGSALGAWAALLPLYCARTPGRPVAHRWVGWMVLMALAGAGMAPQAGPPVGAHGLVVSMALVASGRAEPFTREMLHREPRPPCGRL